MGAVKVLESVAALRVQRAAWRVAGERVALVPTMGALHQGHISLVQLARLHATRVVVSIFVNPTQFAPGEDFAAYPRTFEGDCAMLAAAGADAVFHPGVEMIYPDGFATSVEMRGPAVAGLEDLVRPTHFAGVATIVAKLLIQAAPDVAVFGEKDFQQLAVIRRLVLDLDLPVEIIGAPTLRDPDGLALSSRNAYLSEAETAIAPRLHACLARVADDLQKGDSAKRLLDEARAEMTAAGFAVDYLELRQARDLAPVTQKSAGPMRLLVAAKLGRTRLIDNVAVDL